MADVKALSNTKLITAATMTGTVTGSVDCREAKAIAIQHVWTGTPTGSLKIQASCDGITYSTIDTQALSGAAGDYIVNFANPGYFFIQTSYVGVSGTGVLTSTINTKA
jgi:hypothetical protein